MDDDGPKPAFQVDGELDPTAGEPDDGFTYLKTVRWEANRLPDVHVSTVNPREFDSNQTRKYGARNISSTAPPERLPTPQWEENLLTSLNDLRSVYFEYRRAFEEDPQQQLTVHSYPQPNDEAGWQRFFFGKEEGDPSNLAAEPFLSHLIQFDELAIIRLLKLHIKWSRTGNWTAARLRWLYALLVCLDLPIEAGLQADLWQLRLTCCAERAKSDILPNDIAAGLNIVITTLEKVFGQREC